jgi:flagellin
MAGLNLTDIVLDNANVGQYKVSVTATSMTLTAVASTTGLSGVAISNSIGLSQSIMFEDLAREIYANTDDYNDNATGAGFFKLASSTAINVNFDRLGIKFELTNQDPADAANVSAFATTLNGATLTVSTGTMQAVFQAGANTRDTFVVNGFQDVRIFDRNLNYDGGDQATYMVFSRLNDTLKSMADQTEAVLSSDNFTDLSNRLEDVIVAVTEIRSGLGAQNNRIEYAINNIQAQTESMTAAMGRIRDTDFAAETANLTRLQILQQAATAMLSQANQMPNVVLSLLQ